MRKIVRIVSRLNVGGPAIHAILLSAGLTRFGYETVLARGREGGEEGNMDDLAAAQGVEPLLIPEMGREIRWWDDAAAFWKLYRLIRRERPDIVHTHTAKAGALGRLAAFLAGVPVIVHTFHGHVLSGYFSKWKTVVFIQAERMLARLSSRLITLSPGLKKELVRLGVAPEEKIGIVRLGLDLSRFAKPEEMKGVFKRSLGLDGGTRLVGIVGRLVPIKDHGMFLDAAASMVSRQPPGERGKTLFVIVGDGELRNALEDKVARAGLSDVVRFTGFRSDMGEVYADLEVVVLTSRNEGTPVSLIEAMASGRPVVATRVGGVPDLVSDGETGVLVPAGDSEELARAVSRILGDPGLSTRLGRAARASVMEDYDILRLAADMDRLYQTLIPLAAGAR